MTGPRARGGALVPPEVAVGGGSPTGRQLERAPLHVFHAAVDALAHMTVPESYYRKVLASQQVRAWDVR